MDLETSTSSSPPPTDFSTTNSKRHPLCGGARRRSSRSETREPSKRRRTRLRGTFPSPEMDAAEKLDSPAASSAHVDSTRKAALQAARELSPASSPSTVSRNAGGSISISVDGGGKAEFVDEEAILNMPLLLDCMAEGLLLTPPSIKKGFSWSPEDGGDDDGIFEFNLWEH